MAASISYENVAGDAAVQGQLFAHKKFWVAQRVPMRNYFTNLIRRNGGQMVMMEKTADYMIVDHLRSDCLPGTISYQFIEASVKAGRIQDTYKHQAGRTIGSAREVGSAQPPKSRRAAYTAEEDRICYKWVRKAVRMGGLVDGNEIYKQLELKHPRHPWQSWRDRYRKQLRYRHPSAYGISEDASPSPPSDVLMEAAAPRSVSRRPVQEAIGQSPAANGERSSSRRGKEYTVAEFEKHFDTEAWEQLYAYQKEISSCTGQRYLRAWEEWAEDTPQPADMWRQYFEKVVKPQWEKDPDWKRQKVRAQVEAASQNASSHSLELSQGMRPVSEYGSNGSKEDEALDVPSNPRGKRKRMNSEEILLDEQTKGTPKRDEASAYQIFYREQKYPVWKELPNIDIAQLQAFLKTRWEAMVMEEKISYFTRYSSQDMYDAAAKERERVSKLVKFGGSDIHSNHIAENHIILSAKRQKQTDEPQLPEPEPVPRAWEINVTQSQSQTPPESRPASRQGDTNMSRASSQTPLEPQRDVTKQTRPEQIKEREEETADVNHPKATIDTQREIPETLFVEESVNALSDLMALPPELQSTALDLISNSDLEGLTALPVPDEDESPVPDEDEHNSDTPSPSSQQNLPFDTQAILSSPFHDTPIEPLPPPLPYTQNLSTDDEADELNEADDPTRSPTLNPQITNRSLQSNSLEAVDYPHSEAGTTLSPVNLRRVHRQNPFNPTTNADDKGFIPSQPSSSHYRSRSGSPTSSNSAHSLARSRSHALSPDPDPPLSPTSLPTFLADYASLPNPWLVSALKHTRCRPALAVHILEAWTNGKPLPNKRGIWSKEDDEDVEGPGREGLERVRWKHGMDGWGGVVERLRFLGQWRKRGGK